MKYEEYRRKKWRERIKFDRRNQVDIEEIVREMRQTFGHLCFECQFKRDCPHKKGGTTALLICPHFLQKEKEENTMSDLSPAAKRVALKHAINLMVRIGALTFPVITQEKKGVIDCERKFGSKADSTEKV